MKHVLHFGFGGESTRWVWKQTRSQSGVTSASAEVIKDPGSDHREAFREDLASLTQKLKDKKPDIALDDVEQSIKAENFEQALDLLLAKTLSELPEDQRASIEAEVQAVKAKWSQERSDLSQSIEAGSEIPKETRDHANATAVLRAYMKENPDIPLDQIDFQAVYVNSPSLVFVESDPKIWDQVKRLAVGVQETKDIMELDPKTGLPRIKKALQEKLEQGGNVLSEIGTESVKFLREHKKLIGGLAAAVGVFAAISFLFKHGHKALAVGGILGGGAIAAALGIKEFIMDPGVIKEKAITALQEKTGVDFDTAKSVVEKAYAKAKEKGLNIEEEMKLFVAGSSAAVMKRVDRFFGKEEEADASPEKSVARESDSAQKELKKTGSTFVEQMREKEPGEDILETEEDMKAYDIETGQYYKEIQSRSVIDARMYRLMREYMKMASWRKGPMANSDESVLGRIDRLERGGALSGKERIDILVALTAREGVECLVTAAGATLTLGASFVWKVAKLEGKLLSEVGSALMGKDIADWSDVVMTYGHGALLVGGVQGMTTYIKTFSSGKVNPLGPAMRAAIVRGGTWPISFIYTTKDLASGSIRTFRKIGGFVKRVGKGVQFLDSRNKLLKTVPISSLGHAVGDLAESAVKSSAKTATKAASEAAESGVKSASRAADAFPDKPKLVSKQTGKTLPPPLPDRSSVAAAESAPIPKKSLLKRFVGWFKRKPATFPVIRGGGSRLKKGAMALAAVAGVSHAIGGEKKKVIDLGKTEPSVPVESLPEEEAPVLQEEEQKPTKDEYLQSVREEHEDAPEYLQQTHLCRAELEYAMSKYIDIFSEFDNPQDILDSSEDEMERKIGSAYGAYKLQLGDVKNIIHKYKLAVTTYYLNHPEKEEDLFFESNFFQVGFDSKKRRCYLNHADKKKFKRELFDKTDWVRNNPEKAVQEGRVNPTNKEALGDLGAYVLPISGTKLDLEDSVRAMKRGDVSKGLVSGGYFVMGAVSDVLLLVPLAGWAVSGAIKGARAAAITAKAGVALGKLGKVAKVAKFGVRNFGKIQLSAFGADMIRAFRPDLSETHIFEG